MRLTTLTTALLALAGLACLPGCMIVAGNDSSLADSMSGPSETRTLTVPHVAGSRLDVRTRNGSVEVRQGGTDDVQVTATIRARNQERLSKTLFTVKRDAEGTLQVRVEWPDGPKSNEGASIVVVTPSVPKVSAVSSNGDLLIEADSTHVDAESSNGNIVVRAPRAVVTATSSNGRVHLEGVASADVSTSNAGVTVALAPDATGPLAIRTSNGPVNIDVGPTFAGMLRASTSNAATSVGVGRAVARDGGFDFGPGTPSVVRTSNAPIRVRGS
ncbi:MAG: hypothetical protein RL689_757 [Planctomycetota bacterium]|jgi:hypothetical protein